MLVVSRNPANLKLLRESLEDLVGDVETSRELPRDPEEARGRAGLVILDLDGFGPDAWDVCGRLVEDERIVIVVTKVRSIEIQQEALFHRVRMVLEKPLNLSNLRAIIRTIHDEAQG